MSRYLAPLLGIVLLSAVASAQNCAQIKCCAGAPEVCSWLLGEWVPTLECSGMGRYAAPESLEVAGLVQRRAERWPRIQFEQQKQTGEMMAESLDASLTPYDENRHLSKSRCRREGAAK
jgi:hypothetical protein